MLGKVNDPGEVVMLLLFSRRSSPPILMVWLPWVQLRVSDRTSVRSARAEMALLPKVNAPETVI